MADFFKCPENNLIQKISQEVNFDITYLSRHDLVTYKSNRLSKNSVHDSGSSAVNFEEHSNSLDNSMDANNIFNRTEETNSSNQSDFQCLRPQNLVDYSSYEQIPISQWNNSVRIFVTYFNVRKSLYHIIFW